MAAILVGAALVGAILVGNSAISGWLQQPGAGGGGGGLATPTPSAATPTFTPLPTPTATATPAPTTTPTPTPTATPQTYVVAKGDTLGAIARRFGVTLAALEKANGITDPTLIQIGQRLVIPRP